MADDSGNRMADGTYNARATLRHRDLRTFSEPLRARVPCRTSTLPCRMGKAKGPANGPFVRNVAAGRGHFFAGWTPGLSLKNCLFMSVNFFHWSGTSRSEEHTSELQSR